MTWLKSIKFNLPFLGILILASFIIFYKFPIIPQNLAFDEVEFARLALSLKGEPYTPYSPLATGHATLYFYVLLQSFEVLGVSTLALRLPSAIFGVLSAGMFYLVMREVFPDQRNKFAKYLPFFTALVFISLRWFFQFARFSFEATFLLFLELISLYAALRFFRTKNKWPLIFSGLFAGLAYNSYTPGRIFFLVPLFVIFIQELREGFLLKRFCMNLLYFLIPFVIIILPLTSYISQHGDTRVNQQAYWSNPKIDPSTKAQYLVQNITSTTLSFHWRGDVNGRHNYPLKPALNPIAGVLFLIGFVLTVKNIRNPYNQIFLLYFFVSLIPTLLTYPDENPHMLRTFTVIPALSYIIGTTLFYLLNKKAQKKMLIVVILMVLFSSFYELRTYFLYQTQVFPKAFEIKGGLQRHVGSGL